MLDSELDKLFGDPIERSQKVYEQDKIRAENVATKGNVHRGFDSAVDQLQGSFYGAAGIAGDALGIDAVRDWGFKGYQENQEEASLNPVDVQNFTDISTDNGLLETVSDTGKWFAGTIGQLAPSVAEGIVSTIAGAAIGTATAGPVGTAGGALSGMFGRKLAIKAIDEAVESYISKGMAKELAEETVKNQVLKRAAAANIGANTGMIAGTGAMEGGGMWGEDAEAHGVENANAGSAIGLGLISGASEVVSPGGMLIKRIAGVKGVGSEVADKVADTFLKRLGTEVPTSMGGEAAQEVFQSFLGVLNKKIQDPNVELADREAILEYINSGAAGAAGGMVFGGVSSIAPEKQTTNPDNVPPTVKPQLPPAPPANHTVGDVLDKHSANVAVESAVARQEISAAGPIQDPGIPPKTVGSVLGQEENGGALSIIPRTDNAFAPISLPQDPAGQPAMNTDSNRLDFYLKSMAKSLYPEPGAEGPHENPVWIKKKTLENWEKETGEDIKSFVHSGSAKETLAAVIAGKPLSDKQSQVWGYLKSVAENMAMVDEQTALDDVHSVSGNEKPLAPTGTGELPADFGGEAIVPQTLSSEETSLTKIYQDHGAKVAREVSNAWRQGEKISLEEAKKRVAAISEVEPGTSLATNAEDAGISADEERFTDMVKVLNSQSSAEDLDATAKDMAGIFKVRPELAPFQDRFNAARDEAAKKFTGGQNEEAQGSSVGGSNVQQGSKEEVATTYPEQNNKDTPAEPIPNADRHEVIQNAESVAVGQSVNVAPSEAQAEAGNYKKAHVKIDGLDISIENPSGSTRSGTDKTGNSWQTEMKADYGYIKGSKGYDKDHVDVFMSPGYQGGTETAYVVDQYNDDGSFDEHKVVLGATSEADAMAIYKSNYAAGWTGGKAVSPMPMAEFKEWAKSDAPKSGSVGKAEETLTPERVNLEDTQAASSSGPEIIEHVTKQGKGKTIKGIVRKDITKAEAKAIDPYTFPKDGGFFIREKYLTEDDKAGTGKAQTSDVSINENKPAIDTQESTGEGLNEKEGLSSPPSTDAPVVDNPVPERPIEDFTLESAQELYAQLKEKEREQGTVVDGRLVSRMKQLNVLIKQLQADKDSLTVPGSKEKAVPEVPSTGTPLNEGTKVIFVAPNKGFKTETNGTVSGFNSERGYYTVTSVSGMKVEVFPDDPKAQHSIRVAETEPAQSPLKQEVEKAKEKKDTVAYGYKNPDGSYHFTEYDEGRIENTYVGDTPKVALDIIEGIERTIKNAQTKLDKGVKRGGEALTDKDRRLQENIVAVNERILERARKVAGEKDTPAKTDDVTFVIKSLQTGKEEELTVKKDPVSESPDRFAGNKVFTGDMVKDALARLKARQNTLNSGFNPLDAQDMFIIGGAYFESGVRKFADWAKEVTAAVGKDLAIYLPDVYSMIRKTPGIDTEGISTQEEVDAELNKPAPEETPTPLKEEIEKAKTKPLFAELEKIDAKIEELYQLMECLKS